MTRSPIRRRRSKPRRVSVDRNQIYKDWLKAECKCVICLKFHLSPTSIFMVIIDPCHTSNNGASSKGKDSGCAPLCRCHHDQYDGSARLPNGEVGRKAFEAFYEVDMPKEAATHFAAWRLLEAA